MLLTDRCARPPPERADFPRAGEMSRSDKKGEQWHRAAMTERVPHRLRGSGWGLFLDGLHQAAGGDDVLDKGREGLGVEHLAVGLVGDDAGIKVYLNGVPCLDASTASGHSMMGRPMLMLLR